jgi:hypothetical protein
MSADDHRSGLGALIEVLILSISALVLALLIDLASGGPRACFADPPFDAPIARADIASATRVAP